MKTPVTGASSPSTGTAASKEWTCDPKALRRTSTSRSPEGVLLRPSFDVAREEDHAHTGSPERHPLARRLPERVAQPEASHEQSDGRALPSGQDRPFDAREVFRRPHLHRHHAFRRPVQGIDVPLEIALEGDHSDSHGRKDDRE